MSRSLKFCPCCQNLLHRNTYRQHQRRQRQLDFDEEPVEDDYLVTCELISVKIKSNISTNAFDAIMRVIGKPSFQQMVSRVFHALPKVEHVPCGDTSAAYIPLAPRIQSIYSDKVTSNFLRYPWSDLARGRTSDVYDSERWRSATASYSKDDMYVSLTSDGFGLSERAGDSVTAVILTVINYPPWLRSHADAQMLLMVVKSSAWGDELVRYVAKQLAVLANEGIVVERDAHTDERNVRRRVCLLFTVNDLRAVPHLNRQLQSPALRGACNLCLIPGIRLGQSTAYPGAVRYTGEMDNKLRKKYSRLMPAEVKKLATLEPPPLQTQATINEAQRRAMEGENSEYHGLDAFLEIKEWTTTLHCNDPCHLVVNLLKLMYGLMLNHKRYAYTKERHEVETEFGRFNELSIVEEGKLVGVQTPPWVLTAADVKTMSQTISRTIYVGARLPDITKRFASLRFSDWLLLAGGINFFNL